MNFVLILSTFLCLALPAFQVRATYEPSYEMDNGITVYGEFLYWRVVQDQMEYAALFPAGFQGIAGSLTAEDPAQISEKISIFDPSFKHLPGFRVGFGYEASCSNWDFQLAWTRIHEKTSSHVSSEIGGIFPITIPLSTMLGFSGVTRAESHWHFNFDNVDLQVGRSTSVLDCLALHPFVGIRMASIQQKQIISYHTAANGIHAKNHKKNHFEGIGPSFGLDAVWEFCPDWFLSGSTSGALLCGKFHAKAHPSVTVAPSHIELELKATKKYRVRPVVDASVGIDWNTSLCAYQISLGCSYEMQYWWNQWQAPASFESVLLNGGTSPQGDLMMHGFRVQAAVAF